jgi:hypothetical protein
LGITAKEVAAAVKTQKESETEAAAKILLSAIGSWLRAFKADPAKKHIPPALDVSCPRDSYAEFAWQVVGDPNRFSIYFNQGVIVGAKPRIREALVLTGFSVEETRERDGSDVLIVSCS